MRHQKCFGGVRLLGEGPSPKNVNLLDKNAVPMIACMARNGLRVDLAHFAKLDTELQRDMERITEEVQALTGHYVNIGSGDQVAELLFKKLKLKQARLKLTKLQKRESVESDVLVAIQHEHPVVPMMLNYKELEKLRGTYVVPMPKLAKRVGLGHWRMFPNFNMYRIPSGRPACSDPNLLAMPTRTERGRDIRKGFPADEGHVILSVDESQIEPRVAAHESGDENLIAIYEQQEDLYSDFATSAFHLEDKRYQDEDGKWHYPTVGKPQRDPSKTCMLASLYRTTASGLLEQMPVICANCHLEATKHTCGIFRPLWTEDKCQDIINAFYLRYRGLVQMQRVHDARAKKYGMTWDMWGRWLHLAAVRSVHEWVVSAALREGGNLPIQGGAGGTLKLTMAAVQDDLEQAKMLDIVKPLLPIHDELLFSCREDMAEEVAAHVSYRFETCVQLRVPLKASYCTSADWGSLPK